MKTRILGLLAVGLLAGPMAASGTTLQLVATSADQSVRDFSVVFDDTGDGLFSTIPKVIFNDQNPLPDRVSPAQLPIVNSG